MVMRPEGVTFAKGYVDKYKGEVDAIESEQEELLLQLEQVRRRLFSARHLLADAEAKLRHAYLTDPDYKGGNA